MAKFLKSLKSLFIVEEEVPNAPSGKKKVAPKSEPKEEPSIPIVDTDVEGQVNKKFLNVLLESLEANNLEGFDYLEFKESLRSLKSMDMDEATRFKSAFAMASTMGVTKNGLVETAKHYLAVLAKEENKFQGALENQRAKNLTQRHDRIKKIDEWMVARQQQLDKIKMEMEARKSEREKLEASLQNAATKVEKTKNDFLVTFEYLVKQIEADIDKLNQHLS